MTEYSRPFPGTTIGDAGPYSVRDWWDAWGALIGAGVDFGRSVDYNIGVFYAIANRLAPSENGVYIDIDTGAAVVDGAYYENDATVSIDVGGGSARPSANPRIDYIVVRKNFQQAITYSPANSTATVGPREIRLTVIRGSEGAVPIAPSLTQDTTSTTYWDIPIATVQISTAGVLSNFTDKREFVGQNLGVGVIAADNDTLNTILKLIVSVDGASGANEIGGSIDFQAEDTAGNLENTTRLISRLTTATSGSEDSRFEIRGLAAGSENLNAVFESPAAASVDGNARGAGAVDFQSERSAATQVASGEHSAILAGEQSTASGQRAVVLNGISCEATGRDSIAGGFGNEANGTDSVAICGNGCIADGTDSWVGGVRAKTSTFDNVFVWGDGTNADVTADRDDQFKVRCSGGAFFISNLAGISTMELEQNQAAPVLELDQDEDTSPFVEYDGTSAADQTKNISTVNGDGVVDGPKNFSASAGWAFEGMVRISINGTDRWMPFYSEDTA